jgi:BMFP domain-containing protein YqiC
MKPGPDPKLFDDLARMAGGAVNIFSGLQEQIRSDIRTRMDEMAARLDLVPRDELDQAKAMIEKLSKRIQMLEQRLDAMEGKKPSKPAAKTAVKNPKTTKTKTTRKKQA